MYCSIVIVVVYCSCSVVGLGLVVIIELLNYYYTKYLSCGALVSSNLYAWTRHKLATRMAALLGSRDQFDPSLEDWTNYVERLGQFFEANRIVGDSEDIKKKRRSTFLSVVGPFLSVVEG